MFVLLVFVVVVAAGMVSIYLISNIRTEDPYVYQFLDDKVDDEVWGDKRRGNPYPALNFTIDCSRMDNESQDDCREFLYNQESVLYPEMEKMTGIDLRWCFHTVNMTVYPREELKKVCSERAGACASQNKSAGIAYIKYSPFLIINYECKMDSHELHHIFDKCVSTAEHRELMTVAGGRVEKRLCPDFEYPHNLHTLYHLQIMNDSDDDFEVKDCPSAQAYVIYNSDEEFFHEFYERLLQKKLDAPKKGTSITEAIIYASDEIDENITKHCLDNSGQPLVLEH